MLAFKSATQASSLALGAHASVVVLRNCFAATVFMVLCKPVGAVVSSITFGG